MIYIPGLDEHFEAQLSKHQKNIDAESDRDDMIESLADENSPKIAADLMTKDDIAQDVSDTMMGITCPTEWASLIRATMNCDKETVFSIMQDIVGKAIYETAEIQAIKYIEECEK